jgi:hypothetical protein
VETHFDSLEKSHGSRDHGYREPPKVKEIVVVKIAKEVTNWPKRFIDCPKLPNLPKLLTCQSCYQSSWHAELLHRHPRSVFAKVTAPTLKLLHPKVEVAATEVESCCHQSVVVAAFKKLHLLSLNLKIMLPKLQLLSPKLKLLQHQTLKLLQRGSLSRSTEVEVNITTVWIACNVVEVVAPKLKVEVVVTKI